MRAYEVGQKVYILGPYSRERVGEVVKVGRTLVHVSSPSGVTQYRMDTGWENGEHSFTRIETDAIRADRTRRAELLARLAAAGFEPVRYGGKKVATDVLQRIVEAAEGVAP